MFKDGHSLDIFIDVIINICWGWRGQKGARPQIEIRRGLLVGDGEGEGELVGRVSVVPAGEF